MLALNSLGVLLAHFMLVVIEDSSVAALAIDVESLNPKRLQQLYQRFKSLIHVRSQNIRQNVARRLIDRVP